MINIYKATIAALSVICRKCIFMHGVAPLIFDKSVLVRIST